MSATASTHTVVLLQFTEDENSRTYLDFDSINDALDGICQIYEQKLKVVNQDAQAITYDLCDLINYLDSIRDLSCLTYNDIQKTYIPHGRDWVKSKIYMSLKKQAK
ncbi:rudimentary enhancer [Stylonychia lemnae]|uniref:Enhancer of rudimentary homolog n=1 Tax=Stylonychia lemnae TaxID=5949 RepID=A0A078B1D1_STYLE|nr:rudimentary enhancer [Stylonychia lemnae]|eukprot:CDW86993.1 rudimentary enhancer [Stylonychia lemnae]